MRATPASIQDSVFRIQDSGFRIHNVDVLVFIDASRL